MKLVILIPTYNEEKTISSVIERIPKAIAGIDEIQILVIDDGSTDNTKLNASISGAKVISHNWNRGVGSAFNTGLNKALELGADIMVNIDGDGQFSPDEIAKLIQPVIDGIAEFVAGDRFYDHTGKMSRPEHMSKIKYWGNWCMSKLISYLTHQNFNDVSCGFRAYSREALLWLNLTGKFTYTQETFLDFANKGINIKTLPVSVTYFPDRESKIADNLSNYIVRTIKIILRSYRDYSPLRFFGWLGFFPFIIGVGCGIFMLNHYILTRVFTPYKAVGFIGIYMGSLALLFWIVGLLADMFRRIRTNQEKLLYLEKKCMYSKQ